MSQIALMLHSLYMTLMLLGLKYLMVATEKMYKGEKLGKKVENKIHQYKH